MLYYDGTKWYKMIPAIPDGTPMWAGYYDIWGSSGENVFTVGSYGIIAHYDGNTDGIWSLMNSGVTERLEAVWGSSAENVFVVGYAGTILHYDGNAEGTWTPIHSGTENDLNGLWGSGENNIFAVGASGTILHYNGNSNNIWTNMQSGTENDLKDIWGSGEDNIFAVGDFGKIVHYDGNADGIWSSMYTRTDEPLSGIWGSSEDNIFVTGENDYYESGKILRYDGVPYEEDNCPDHHNPDQADSDRDSIGDMCDDTDNRICPIEKIYGEHSEKTELLRNFRNSVLNKTKEGQAIIKLYYKLSPEIMRAMEEDEMFKKNVKEMIDGVLPLIKGERE